MITLSLNIDDINTEEFRRLRSHLDALYDITANALPYVEKELELTITVDSPTYISVYIRRNGGESLLWQGNVDSTATLRVLPSLGTVEIWAESAAEMSNILNYNFYNIHTFLYVFSKELERGRETLQDIKDGILVETTKEEYLTRKARIYNTDGLFGYFNTNEEFRQFLEDLVKAFSIGGSLNSIVDLIEAFFGETPIVVEWKDLRFNRVITITDRDAKLYYGGAENIIWDSFDFKKYNRTYSINSDSITATDPNYYFIDLGTVVTSSTFPYDITTFTETYSSSSILNDVDGTITGVKNGKYLWLNNPAKKILDISSSGSYNIDNGWGWQLLSPRLLSLGTTAAQTELGDVTVRYIAEYYPPILGRYRTDYIEFNDRVSETFAGIQKALGLRSISYSKKIRTAEIFIRNVPSKFFDFEDVFFEVLSQIKPLGKCLYFYVEQESPPTPPYTYDDKETSAIYFEGNFAFWREV